MVETAVTLLKGGLAAMSEFNEYVETKSGLPLTITTDAQAATPPCALITPPSRMTYGIGGGEGRCSITVALILPFMGGGIEDVLHVTDLIGSGLYRFTARSSDGTRLTRIEVEGIEESGDRPGVWAVSLFCEFAY